MSRDFYFKFRKIFANKVMIKIFPTLWTLLMLNTFKNSLNLKMKRKLGKKNVILSVRKLLVGVVMDCEDSVSA